MIVMSRLSKFVLPTVLLALMVLASSSSVLASTELAYDDDTAETAWSADPGIEHAVRFSLPPGWSSAKLIYALYFIFADPAIFRVHVYGSGVTDPALDNTPFTTGWSIFDLTAYNIVVTGDFYISIEYLTAGAGDPPIGCDETGPIDLRTYSRENPGDPWELSENWDLMIRAWVDPVSRPVGGFVIPVNKLTILAPYLAIVGLIGAVTVAFATTRRRKT